MPYQNFSLEKCINHSTSHLNWTQFSENNAQLKFHTPTRYSKQTSDILEQN